MNFSADDRYFTCHHERPYAFGSTLHGCFHHRSEAMAVPALSVKPRKVVQQVVGNHAVTYNSKGQNTFTIMHLVYKATSWLRFH